MEQLVDNRYRIERPLGNGGMAEVYLAHDDVLGRDVALKVMNGRYAHDDEFVERFRREAQHAAALSHPNIVPIYDRGESETGTYYIAMEYLSGGTLKDRILKRGPLPARTAAAVAAQIAEALQVAHRKGVIHRDIKPHNILITDSGDIKVTDFGIARAASSSTMTRTGSIMGTAHYISPEQAMGESVGPPSDLYSLGVVLYEMLTGELPYDAETPIGIAMKHVNGQLKPPIEVDPSIPEGINAITCRLLAKDPKDRYASAAELAKDLDRASEGMSPLSGATTRIMNQVTPPMQSTRRNTRITPPNRTASARTSGSRRKRGILPWIIALAILALLIPLGWAGYNLLQNQQGSPPANAAGNNNPRISVPNLSVMTLDKAHKKVGKDFNIKVADRKDSEKPVDTILSQKPDGGKAAKGSDISVTVSGKQVAGVPDVQGSTRDQAEGTLKDAGFKVKVEEQTSDQSQEGLVTGQSPGAGEKAGVGSEVKITVGKGPNTVAVPDLPYGATASEAQSQLEGVGLKLGNQSEAPSSSVAKGGVIDQSPTPGTQVNPGTAVDITLSSGPQQISVPSVVGQNVEAAKQTMLNAGLGYNAVQVQSDQAAGTVVSTDPSSGTNVDPGTQVKIFYSSGPPQPAPQPQPTPQPQPASQPAPQPVPQPQPGNQAPVAGQNQGSNNKPPKQNAGGDKKQGNLNDKIQKKVQDNIDKALGKNKN